MLSSVTPSQSVSTQSNLTQQFQKKNVPEKDELWSGILKSVALSKVVPTRNILVLGEPGVGKSTLIHYLRNDPGPQRAPLFEDQPSSFNVSSHHYTPNTMDASGRQEQIDLALGYSFVDVKDDENEAMARLGLYQLSLSSAEFLPLLKFAIRADTIMNSSVLILVDWTRPWTFVETLERWIHVLHYLINEISKEGTLSDSSWSKGKAVIDELKEKLEHHLQTYTESSSSLSNPITVTASTSTSSLQSSAAPTSSTVNSNTATTTPAPTLAEQQVMLPLSAGYLTSNLGIPITVVCTKSDAITKLEQTHDYNDDQFDYIQQTLRCICMKYGASLFYTSTLHSYTFHNLREYILHRTLTAYPFHIKAQVIERDTILVPAGWDSWGKIKVLKEGFDCDHVSEGWDADMDAVIDRQKPGNTGARGTYKEAIPNGDESEIQPQYNIPVITVCEDEQSFYDRHYEKLQKNQDQKPAEDTSRPGVVGPIGISPAATLQNMMRTGTSNTLSLSSTSPPAVTKDDHAYNNRKKDLNLEKLLMKGIDNKQNGLPSSPTTVPSSATITHNASPASPVNQNNAPSHEVLANFFQSLLKNSSNGASGPGSPTATHSPGGQPNGRSHKELDVMRQFTASK